MSKSKLRNLYILLGILAVVCVAAFAVSRHEEQRELIKNSDEMILTLDSASVTALSWAYDDVSLAFHKEEAWLCDEDEAFPVDEEKIADLLEQFTQFGVTFIIEEVEDYGQYGLEDPTCTIQITAGEETYDIALGAYSTMDEQRYVSIGDGNVYLVQHDPMEDYELTLKDMIRHDTIPELSGATAISFAGTENYEIVYQEESTNTYCSEDVYFTEDSPLDTDSVSSYLSRLSNLSLSEYVTYNATEEELAAFGLDTPELSVTVTYERAQDENTPADEEAGKNAEADADTPGTVTETFVLHIGRNQEELAAAREEAAAKRAKASETGSNNAEKGSESAAAGSNNTGKGLDSAATGSNNAGKGSDSAASSGEAAGSTWLDSEEEDPESGVTAYARVGDSPIVYEITALNYSDLTTASYDDLRHQEVLTASFEDIYQMDIALEGKSYTLTTTEEDDEITWYYNEEELDPFDLQNAVEALKADSFTQEKPSQKEEISLTVYLGNEHYPEITVQLYRYDGTSCLAVVDGTPVSLVPRSQVVDLVEAVNAIVLN